MLDEAYKTILLVEDDGIIAMNETMILEENGYKVVTAATGEEAVETAKNDSSIELILMDINLGDGMDGTSAAQIILNEIDIPLIFLSSHTEKEIVEKTEGITSYGYIVKNSGDTVMLTSIKMAFKLFTARQEVKEAEAYLKDANITLDSTFNSINDAIILLDMNNRIEKCNEAFKQFTGKDENDIIGSFCMELIHNDCDHPEACPFLKMRKSRKREKMELPLDGKYYEVIVDPLFDSSGELIKAVHIITDITEQKKAEELLKSRIISLTRPESKEDKIRFEDLFDLDEIQKLQDAFGAAAGVATGITRPDGETITRPSNSTRFCSEIINRTEKGIKNCRKSDSSFGFKMDSQGEIFKCKSAGLWDAGAGIYMGGKHIANWSIGQVRDDSITEDSIVSYAKEIGADVSEALKAFAEIPVMDKKRFEELAHFLFIMVDLLSRVAYQNFQQAKMLAELQTDEIEIKKLLSEKEVLLKEVHHRLKNNLASVESLLSLQQMNIEDEASAAAVQDAALRVSSIRVMYEKLLSSDQYANLPVKTYAEDIINGIRNAYSEFSKVEIIYDIGDIVLDSKLLFSFGLIVNELVSNIFKHAFEPGRDGVIRFVILKDASGIHLEITDNGKGLPEGFTMHNTKSFGLYLVRMLAEQMSGSFRMKNIGGQQPGTVCSILIKPEV